MNHVVSEVAGVSEQEREAFQRLGYLVVENALPADEIEDLKVEIDAITDRAEGHSPAAVDHDHLLDLVTTPVVMGALGGLMGPSFAFHHLHAVRQDAGSPGVNWHQDYEQEPQTNRSHVMVHVFYYLNGLNGEVGDLLLVPGSQNIVARGDAFWFFGTEDLPGSIVVDKVNPGAAVIVHSALWHARRAKPGGEGRQRYFADASYCQAGVLWPRYGGSDWPDKLDQLRARATERGSIKPEVFDKDFFFDRAPLREKVKLEGSLLLQAARD